MSARVIEVDGSGEDGAMIWWDPGQLPVAGLKEALEEIKMGGLLPKASTVPAALRETLSGFIEAAKVKVRGKPVTINQLAEDVKGFEAVRQDRGSVENYHDFVMSIVLDEPTQSVKIAKYNEQHVPQIGAIQEKLEAKMTEIFRGHLDHYPTSMVSSCLARVISRLGGVLCRKSGGVYFLPESSAQTFEPLADKIDTLGGVAITITKFPLRPGERSYELVVKSLREEISTALVEIEEGLKELGTKKQRANGEATRLEMLVALKAKVTRYEALLGVAMTDIHEAVDKVKQAVAAHNAMEACV
jgi:hypothetical protein